jgi:hypothetical protein
VHFRLRGWLALYFSNNDGFLEFLHAAYENLGTKKSVT